ncbi:MAG: hypothetical protein KGZ71_08810 [Desulfobulbaceae bacterium]|nr:hypothetical protein [Candidatus Kapabacteria bacterium]MBS4000568.1 hypothetical protein [Desulfobulbaceae bacterium]
MEITARITGIKYKFTNSNLLPAFALDSNDVNKLPTACLIEHGKHQFAISKWVSPKRTRSYPYERVYNTLSYPKRITIIPIIKDEGLLGDRDYIQWDTISLMSLLDVYVILGYYHKASKRGSKITKQQFENSYIKSKIIEISQYHSSALHWNLNELNANIHNIIDNVRTSYEQISIDTGVQLHNPDGIVKFKEQIGKDVSLFMNFSRNKALQSQSREFITIQPKERLASLTKAKITINNYLGGLYYLTVDEILIDKTKLKLIESKHSANNLFPSRGDIKDGLLKMVLFSNLVDVEVNGITYQNEAYLNLTSSKLVGEVSSNSSKINFEEFVKANLLTNNQLLFIQEIFKEARLNNFTINIQHSS